MRRASLTGTILVSLALLGTTVSTVGCDGAGRARFPSTQSALPLEKVVLYRNGVGYFQRHGTVDGDVLRIRVRKDQINDLLKSLTVVDRNSGQAVSVSMPLDPETWANAALATLAPGRGSLAQVLDLLRGVEVKLDTVVGSLEGRIVMVEKTDQEPDPRAPSAGKSAATPTPLGRDHRVTVLEGNKLRVVRLSKIKSVTLKDGDLAMQFHRRLDAAAGEGMFQQVEVSIFLAGDESHDLVVSYVVEAPMWKPTYRVVLPEDGRGKALLQAWAVIDNTSGEDWRQVKLSLTAGAPLAFRYDLHTPRRVFREDLSERVHQRRARVMMGESSYDDADAEAEEAPTPEPSPVTDSASSGGRWAEGKSAMAPPAAKPRPSEVRSRRSRLGARKRMKKKGDYGRGGAPGGGLLGGLRDEKDKSALDFESLMRSTSTKTTASRASGLTRYDVGQPVTVPDGSSTMVAIINQAVEGREAFLYNPQGGAGQGYEQNPFRVVRFRNTTPFVLESGPISIYSGGSFVGEGISKEVGAGAAVTIPFAVEPGIIVKRETPNLPEELRLLKIVRGTIHAESFFRVKTVWKVQALTKKDGFRVLVRHPQRGGAYKLAKQPAGMEEVPGAYLVPIDVPAGKRSGSVELIEQTPRKVTIALHGTGGRVISIWRANVLQMFERALVAEGFSEQERAKLRPLVALRRAIGKIDGEVSSLQRRARHAKDSMRQTRLNIEGLKEMKGREAQAMYRSRNAELERFTKEYHSLKRELMELEKQRRLKVIAFDGLLARLTISAAK